MNPILRDRKSLILYLLVWSSLAFLLAALLVIPGKAGWAGAIAFSLPLMIIYAFISLSAWYVCRAFPLGETSFVILFSVLLLSAILSSALWGALGFAWAAFLDSVHPEFASRDWHGDAVPLLAATGVVLFLLSAVVHYLIFVFEKSRAAERNALELQVLARNAELKALRAQINPHFLFNSLNSVSALTAGNPAAARVMTLKLADFLRMSMEYGSRNIITLEQELSIAKQFLEIEKVRFGSRLNIEMDVEECARSRPVPALVLQPLVENAVNHGIAHIVEGGTVRITARAVDGKLQVSIENPVDPDAPAGTGQGVGLENVRERVLRLYAAEGRVETRREPNRYSVTLSFPAG